MNTLSIFTDAAISPQQTIAVGAYLYLDQNHLQKLTDCSIEQLTRELADRMTYQKYNSKKSTWTEIQNVIDALTFLQNQSEKNNNVTIYTDCQSLCDLLGKRKAKLQKSNFITRSGKILQNADLYQKLYAIADCFQISIIKIKGHASQRITIEEKIFSVVDKLCRKKLRFFLSR